MTNGSDMSAQATAEGIDRAATRINFFLTTEVSSERHAAMTARVRNLSAGGMMIEFKAEPEPDLAFATPVVAQLRGIGRVCGRIAWRENTRFGIKFDSAVDPELARKSVAGGTTTPDFVKPLLLKDRTMRKAKTI